MAKPEDLLKGTAAATVFQAVENEARLLQPGSSRFIENILEPVIVEGHFLDKERLMAAFLQRRWHHCHVILAVLYDMHDKLEFTHKLNYVFVSRIVHILTANKLWIRAMKMLHFMDKVLMMAWHCALEEEDQVALHDCLGEGTSGIKWLIRWFHVAASQANVPQFKLLLLSNNKHVQQAVDKAFLERPPIKLVTKTCDARRSLPVWENVLGVYKVQYYTECLRIACEAGVFTRFANPWTLINDPKNILCETPLGMAVFYNQPDLVELLYKAAAASDRIEVLWVSQNSLLKERCEAERTSPPAVITSPLCNDVDAAQKIRSFLCSKAAQPLPHYLFLREVGKRPLGGRNKK